MVLADRDIHRSWLVQSERSIQGIDQISEL
jgi:hypothetical protein